MSDSHSLDVAYLPWITIQCTLPHSRQLQPSGREVLTYERLNGRARLVMQADPRYGLPYGKIPRMALAHLVREYKRTGERRLVLGRTFAGFLRAIGMDTGGKTRAWAHEQLLRLFSADITSWWLPDGPDSPTRWVNQRVATEGELWWDPEFKANPQMDSYILLSEGFASSCEYAVPIDLNTCMQLRSPLAIDLYCWLTYRASTLSRPSRPIPWAALMEQFGHGYSRPRNFKPKLRESLGKVLSHYPADVREVPEGLILRPCPPHVPQVR